MDEGVAGEVSSSDQCVTSSYLKGDEYSEAIGYHDLQLEDLFISSYVIRSRKRFVENYSCLNN